MGSVRGSGERIEALRALMDRLGSPDLTLGEAQALRCRLFALTGVEREVEEALGVAHPAAKSSIPCEGHQHGSRSPECRDCAA